MEHISSIIYGIILFAIIGLVFFKVIKKTKEGGSCGGCGDSCSCSSASSDTAHSCGCGTHK